MDWAMDEKRAEERDLIRSVRTDIINFSERVSKWYTPQQIEPIPIIDNVNLVIPIKTIEQALKLLKEFK